MGLINEPDIILTSSFTVTSAETDMEGRLRLGSLVNLLVQSAINSADSLGFGFGGIRQQNLYWVLSRLTLEIYRPLRWYEKVEVETWPKNVEKILYIRDFLVRDKNQNFVAKATSGWLAIDIETRRARKIDGIHADLFVHLRNRHALQELPVKLNSVSEGDVFEFKSDYYDIDLNKHLSATRYIDRMMDTLPFDFHINHYPTKMSVNYLKETLPGEKLKFTREQLPESDFRWEGINTETNTSAFRGRIEF